MTSQNAIRCLLLLVGGLLLYLGGAEPHEPAVLRGLGLVGAGLILLIWWRMRSSFAQQGEGDALRGASQELEAAAVGSGLVRDTRNQEMETRSGIDALQGQSAAQILTLFDALPLGALALDAHGHVLRANAAAQSILGFGEEELIGQSLHETVHEPGMPSEAACILCHGGVPLAPEARAHVFWTKNGLRVPIEATIVALSLPLSSDLQDGEQPDLLLLFEDRREHSVLKEKLRATFTASADALLVFDSEGRLIDVNPASLELFGAERSLLMSEFSRFIPLVQADGAPSDFIGCLQNALLHGSCSFVWNWYDVSGSEIPTEVILVRISYEGGDAIFATLHDLRSLMNARNAVELERARLQLVLNVSPIGMCMLRDGVVKEHNQCLTEISSLSQGDVFADVIVNPARRSALLEQMADRGCVSEFEVAVYAPTNGIRQVMLTALKLEWQGELRTLCWLVDITRLKEIEHDLVIARDAAEEATRAKSNFLAQMSHEIRTPMNAIIGMSYLCRQTGLSSHQLEYMDKLETAADKLVGIISDILEFTMLQSGHAEALAAPFSLLGTLDEMLAPLQAKAHQRGLAWSFDVAPDVPDALYGDAPRLMQILTGLLSNALKFTEQGRVELRITRTLESDTHVWLHFTVSDTGIGLSREQLDAVFEVFTQADPSLTRRHGGTGLGLTITKYLVELLGGSLWAESEEGHGSVFHCTIPFNPAAAPCEVTVPIVVRRPEEYVLDEFAIPQFLTPSPGVPGTHIEVDMHAEADSTVVNRVLLVEDNEINQEIACELLRDLGLDPQVADNGAQAVEAAASEDFALIFMDIQMPVMDGLEATRRIRAIDSAWAKNVPIIAMTAHALQDDRDQSMAVGMNAHLTKPIEPSMLQRMVDRWLPGFFAPVEQEPLGHDESASAAKAGGSAAPFASSRADLQNLYGVNVAAGIANVVGNEKLYTDLLRRFAAKYRDSHHELAGLIHQHDIEGAARLAHTIKGVAANLGAGALADLVKKIESGVLSGEDVSDLLTPYEDELVLVTAGIDALQEAEVVGLTPVQMHSLDAEVAVSIRTGLEDLPILMQTDWGQAQEKVEALNESLAGTGVADLGVRLLNALEDFDVKAFTEAVQELKRRL